MAGGACHRFLPVFCHDNLILPGSCAASSDLVAELAAGRRTILTRALRQTGAKNGV